MAVEARRTSHSPAQRATLFSVCVQRLLGALGAASLGYPASWAGVVVAGSEEGGVRRRSGRLSHQAIDLGLLFVVLVWGFSPTLFKVALEELDPLAFAFVRFVLLSVVAVAVLAVRGARGGRAWRIARADVPLLIVSGLSGYGVYQLLYMVGLARTTIFDSALLASTIPLWTALLLLALRLDRIAAVQWLGIVLGFGGVAWFLLAAPSGQSEISADRTLTSADLLVGNALTLAAAALFAVYGIVNRRLGARYSPPELMCYTLIVGTLALAPLGVPAVLAQDWSRVTWPVWAIIPYSVLFPIYITYSIWNWAITRRGAAYVSLYSYAVPLTSGLVGFALAGEPLSVGQLLSAVVVLGGMLLAWWGIRRAQLRMRKRDERTAGGAKEHVGAEAATSAPLVPLED
jgi:drug/metabolite transporter (DMT)-like permease